MEKVRPFVKWAGGKSQLIGQINQYLPTELTDGKIKTYIEPFVGGGAVLIEVLQKYDVENAIAFDINADLINCYLVVKNNVEELIAELDKKEKKYKSLENDKRKEYFYEIRTEYNSYELQDEVINIKRASEFIFLNKTCFNGLYRVNSNNKFNVPFNNAKNTTICDSANLRNLSKLIQNVNFYCGDYKKAENFVNQNTFIYFDPPYRPLNGTSGFTSYTKDDFNDDDQRNLGRFYKELSLKGAKLMLSNSNPKNINTKDNFFVDLYDGFNLNEVLANRNINSKGNGRKAISELLITNY